jgi:hypothetical protein
MFFSGVLSEGADQFVIPAFAGMTKPDKSALPGMKFEYEGGKGLPSRVRAVFIRRSAIPCRQSFSPQAFAARFPSG